MSQFTCNVCGWVFDESAEGKSFADLPDDWGCPVCNAKKEQFTKKQEEDEPKSGNSSSYLGSLERLEDDIEQDLRSIFLKAVTGKTEMSSMRTFKHENILDDILFVPGQLHRKPLREDEVNVELKTVIGAKAQKPLILDLPYFVSHMSYGALSREAKIALAKGSAAVKTATCSGEGGMLPEERNAAYKYIFEYSTGKFGATEEVMKQADAIEIKIGQSAKAGLGGHLPAEKVTEEIAKVRNVKPFTEVISPANHADINSKEDLKDKVDWLRKVSGGVPIGIKIVAGDIENDLEFALFSQPDFITFDCRGGSTGTAPTHVKDNMSFPAPYAIHRARQYFLKHDIKDISLIITGGLRTSGDIAKCLAMGADTVALATVSMIGIGCQQYRVCQTGNCPIGLATQDEELRKNFNTEESAKMLANLFTVYGHELEDFVRIVGKKSIHTLTPNDLITINTEISQFAGIKHA